MLEGEKNYWRTEHYWHLISKKTEKQELFGGLVEVGGNSGGGRGKIS